MFSSNHASKILNHALKNILIQKVNYTQMNQSEIEEKLFITLRLQWNLSQIIRKARLHYSLAFKYLIAKYDLTRVNKQKLSMTQQKGQQNN